MACLRRLVCRYTSHMPEAQAVSFIAKFEAELDAAEAQCPPGTVTVMLCDGARPIWNCVAHNERFADYETLVNYYHTIEPLALVSQALFGDGSEEAAAWYDKYAARLLEHDHAVQSILHSMAYYAKSRKRSKGRTRALQTQRTFFLRNHSKMHYASFRRRGLAIGSGPIEAACKSLVKTRLCRSGMRWSRQGGQHILDLHTYVKSNRWDYFWAHYKQRRQGA